MPEAVAYNSSYTGPQIDEAIGRALACPTINIATITLNYADWTWSSGLGYTQTVTIPDATITSKTKVDLNPSSYIVSNMITQGVTYLCIENNNGTLTAVALGEAPTTTYTVSCSYYETA